jgi:hypothetical protein
MPASVNVVFNTLKDLVNKDQQGFVTVDEFNRFAQVAQLRIFNRLFDSLKDGSRLERAGFGQGRDKSKFKQINEDLATFAKTDKDVDKVSGVFPRPSDFARLISVSTKGGALLGRITRTPIQICYDEEKIERILSSTLNAPTTSYPVALVSGDIEVFPESINKIQIRYYKIPQSFTTASTPVRSSSPPTFGVATNSTTEQYDADNSFDFELPEHYTMDLVVEIAQLIGVNLRDQQVEAFADKEQLERKNEQTF